MRRYFSWLNFWCHFERDHNTACLQPIRMSFNIIKAQINAEKKSKFGWNNCETPQNLPKICLKKEKKSLNHIFQFIFSIGPLHFYMFMHLLFMLFILLVGAFIPGVPVQPVLIRYPNNMVRMSDYNPTLPECTLYYTRSSATDATMELCISYRDKNENKQWFKMIDVYVMGFSCRIL